MGKASQRGSVEGGVNGIRAADNAGKGSGLKTKAISRSGNSLSSRETGKAGFNGNSRAPHCSSAR
ncbi:hypothetical protein D3C80_1648900 [compost metagenome]